jgi:LemA protein
MEILLIILVGLLIGAVWLYSVYVGVIKKKNKVKEAFASIDVQLKKRYDLIPNILMMANKFMEHERSLIEDVTKLRTQALNMKSDFASMQEKINIEHQLQQKMGQLMVSVENYPQLKSNETMTQAMQTFAEMEEQISASRRFYNAAILDLNNAVEIYPSSLFASSMGLTVLPFFEIKDDKEKKSINAMDYFSK